MEKKKVWIAGCTIFLLLFICTVLSLRIEKMMRIEVEIERGIPCSENGMESMSKIPLSCFKEEDGSMVLFYIEEKEGLFGKELAAVKEEKYPAAEDGNMAFVAANSLQNEQGASKRIVNYSVWPLEDGDIVTIVGEDE